MRDISRCARARQFFLLQPIESGLIYYVVAFTAESKKLNPEIKSASAGRSENQNQFIVVCCLCTARSLFTSFSSSSSSWLIRCYVIMLQSPARIERAMCFKLIFYCLTVKTVQLASICMLFICRQITHGYQSVDSS